MAEALGAFLRLSGGGAKSWAGFHGEITPQKRVIIFP
jgi:hypothetical protein